MDFTTDAVANILRELDRLPADPGKWRQLMILCFDQKDTDTFHTLQVITEGLEKLLVAHKRRAQQSYKNAVMDAAHANRPPPQPLTGSLSVPVDDLQKSLLRKTAREPNNPAMLKAVGKLYLEEWEMPEVARRHFERALIFAPESEELRELVSKSKQAFTGRDAPEPHANPQLGLTPVGKRSLTAHEVIRKTGRLLVESASPLSQDRIENVAVKTTLAKASGKIRGEQGDLKTANMQVISQQLQSIQKKMDTIAGEPSQAQLEQSQKEAAELLNQSLAAIQDGQLEEALRLCRKAHQIDPKVPLGWHTWATLGLAFFDQQRNEEAIQAYEEALRLEPTALESWFNLGVAYFQIKRLDEALRCYKQASLLDPQNAKVACNMGAVYYETGELQKAEECFRLAVEVRPDYARAWDNLSAALSGQNKLKEAAEACRKAVDLKPEYPEAWFKLGTILFQSEQYADAAEAFLQVLDFNPHFGQAYGYMSILHSRAGDLPAAERMLRKMEQYGVTQELAWMVWNDYSAACASAGYYDEALRSAKRATEIHPGESDAWLNLGIAHYRLQHMADAERAYLYAVQLNPNSARACHCLGVVRYATGNYADAVEAFAQATEIDPRMINAWFDLGSSLQMENRLEEAVRAYQKVVELDANNAQAWAGLGTIYLHQRDNKKAVEAFARATQAGATGGAVWRHMGRAYENLNDWQQACACHQKATEASPDSAEIWQSLAGAYQRLGDHDKASAAMRRALALSGQ
jgi:tetratricopeptide (TPR) repeat protein